MSNWPKKDSPDFPAKSGEQSAESGETVIMTDIQETLQGRQYLTFFVREENFAIEIAKVREVLDVATLTKIPRMPEYMLGVINLRGNVVPVLDLGQKLGMVKGDWTHNTCIIIVEFAVDDNQVEMGVLVDSVQMVINFDPDDIEEVPRMGTGLQVEFIKGMGRLEADKFLIILDIDAVLENEGEAVLRDLSQQDEAA